MLQPTWRMLLVELQYAEMVWERLIRPEESYRPILSSLEKVNHVGCA